ncbi:MAG: DUF5320 domain-containing protein [Candidatus Aenigmarchaeota archaeon]|nr:DUF5320 domain-containing protein [Candidatus Aenigmarchaeota archaeon]
MPRGDGTGPAGQGPKTGRGKGYCEGGDQPGYLIPGQGLGHGYGGRYGTGGRFSGGPKDGLESEFKSKIPSE